MNNKLFNDLLNARGKINKVIALRQEFSDINIKLSKYDNLYDVRSNLCGGPIFQSIVIEIVTVLLVALGSIILQQFKEPTKAENLLFRDLAIWAPVVLIVLNLIRRPFAKKRCRKKLMSGGKMKQHHK